jgi:hypothetical protein
MEKLVKRLRLNPVFNLVSSVKLAVPLLLTVAVVVGVGTVLESRYGAQYAKIAVYHAKWFDALMVLLWINIFTSTISRWPFKRHHTGFVITHLGLLTLLAGGLITSRMGLDGQLRVSEGESSNEVVLSNLILEAAPMAADRIGEKQRVDIERRLTSQSLESMGSINDRMSGIATVIEYLPFAKAEERYVESTDGHGLAIGIFLRSPFFSVGEWLHETEKPELKMGPATLRIIKMAKQPIKLVTVDSIASKNNNVSKKLKVAKVSSAKAVSAHKAASKIGDAKLIILDQKTGAELKQISINELKAQKPGRALVINSVKISLKGVFEQATVVDNHLADGGMPGANPALELSLEHNGATVREIAYARYPDFSLNQKGTFDLKFRYQLSDRGPDQVGVGADAGAGAKAQTPSNHPATSDKSGAEQIPSHAGMASNLTGTHAEHANSRQRPGNVIECLVDENDLSHVQIDLYKNNSLVQSEIVSPGETIQTPWMGMKITISGIVNKAVSQTQIVAAPLVEKTELPGAALRILPAGAAISNAFWLSEGQERGFSNKGQNYQIYFGPDFRHLPFSIHLKKFSKVDYPGSEMAMSFESLINVADTPKDILISMNEPLKMDGYTFYQSSYDLQPGHAPASIFSVNQDPGRPIKYLGSLILAIGIITYTMMKSRVYKRKS